MNKIICGDSKEELLKLPEKSVHLIITSPPYYNWRKYSQWKRPEDYIDDMITVMIGCYRILVDGGVICWNIMGFGEWDWASHSSVELHNCGFKFQESIIWQKPLGSAGPRVKHIKARGLYYPSAIHEQIFVYYKGDKANMNILDENERNLMMKKYQSNIWEITPVIKMSGQRNEYTGEKENLARHEAPFPKEIVMPFVIAYSKPGDIVLDCFAGTGTTCRVAYETNRNYIGIEIDPESVALSERNMAQRNLFGKEKL